LLVRAPEAADAHFESKGADDAEQMTARSPLAAGRTSASICVPELAQV
jgi:hypothetical protein